MCGIFGVYNFKSREPVNRDLLKQSTNLLEHRGPDGYGEYFDDLNGLGFGHRRLSIIDLNTGNQPMCNEDGSVWITFNGEIYNFPELKNYLISKGHNFKTKSDTEVLIHGYEEFGEELPKKLNGIFAFAIWNKNNKTLFLARDHFGVKPLYYYYDSNKLIFSSELKAILKYSGITREININSLSLCLRLRHTPAPETLIKNINKLPASNYIFLKNDSIFEMKSYWDSVIYINRELKEKEWIESLQENFERSVKMQMISDVPIGISLSGGVDSGSIFSLMNKYSGAGIHTFTINFASGKKSDDESIMAEQNAKRFNAEFYLKTVTYEDYLDFFDKYIWHLEEPIGNESAMSYYFVAELAKGKVKVLLNGQGADEPFAGYDRYLGMYYSDKFNFLSKIIINAYNLFQFSPTRKTQMERLRDYISYKTDPEKILSASSISTKSFRKIIFKDYLFKLSENISGIDTISSLINKNIGGTTLERMLFYDMFSSLSENLLLCEDKMSMAKSIEVRVPFLDVEFVKLALSVPVDLKINKFSGKYIHKLVCEKYLPKNVVHQNKVGFNNPMNDWFRGLMGKELRNMIEDKNSITNLYLKKNAIINKLDEHEKKYADHTKFLFLLFSLEKWNNVFIKKENIV